MKKHLKGLVNGIVKLAGEENGIADVWTLCKRERDSQFEPVRGVDAEFEDPCDVRECVT